MKFLPLILVSLLVAVMPDTATAADRQSAYVLDPEMATRAVLQVHPELAGDSMELAAPISLREPSPVLQAGPVERSGATGRVRLHCEAQSACLPFYVLVHLPATQIAVSRGSARAASVGDEPVLRSGDHASMLIDSGLLHLRVPVTCLQPGTIGQTIRVTGPSRSKVYQVAIVDRSTVRGSL